MNIVFVKKEFLLNICIMAIMSLLFSSAMGVWHMGNVCIEMTIVAKNSKEGKTRLSFEGKTICF